MTESFPGLRKEMDTQIQKASTIWSRISPKRTTVRNMIIKLSKVKAIERILRATIEEQFVTYKGASIRLWVDFSAETLYARNEWMILYSKCWKKKLSTKNTVFGKTSLKSEGETKTAEIKKSLRISLPLNLVLTRNDEGSLLSLNRRI